MKTSIILIGSAEEIKESINRVYIEPRNKVYTPEKDGFDIKQQLEEISAKNEAKMGVVNFIALKQPRADSEDIHLYLESLYVRIVDNSAKLDPNLK